MSRRPGSDACRDSCVCICEACSRSVHVEHNRETNRIGVLCQNDRGETIAEQRHDNHNDTTASGRLRSAALPAFGSLSIHTTAIACINVACHGPRASKGRPCTLGPQH